MRGRDKRLSNPPGLSRGPFKGELKSLESPGLVPGIVRLRSHYAGLSPNFPIFRLARASRKMGVVRGGVR